jgi:primosomal protein N' (replication factor Y)
MPIAGRGWPRVEIVDLREEPPGAGLLSRALGPAIQRALADDAHALVVVNRKGRAHLLVCRTCGTVAECARCGARLSEGAGSEGAGAACERCAARSTLQCRRCGSVRFQKLRPGVTGLRDAIAGLVPNRRIVAVDAASAPVPAFDVAVGTEAVLHRVRGEGRPIRLVAFPEIDQELLAPRYRAAEQALWLLVRAARLLGSRDTGGSILVQTRVPDHEVLRAAQTGDPTAVLAAEAQRRRELAYPPFGGLAEISGAPAAVEAACDALRAGLTVLGPTGGRALLRGPTVDALCDALAATDLGPARALGRLRVDVDPLRV